MLSFVLLCKVILFYVMILMQNKSMPAAPLHRPGALLLGDAFNMRHPLTGQIFFIFNVFYCVIL